MVMEDMKPCNTSNKTWTNGVCVCVPSTIYIQFFCNVSAGLDKSTSLVGNLGKQQDIVNLTGLRWLETWANNRILSI